MPEREPHVVDHHHRVKARLAVFSQVLSRLAHQALLFRLAVGVLKKYGKQFQGVALRTRGAARRLFDQIKFRPRPTGPGLISRICPSASLSMAAGSNVS